MRILVDADACPVKDEIERLAAKRGILVTHVCSLGMKRTAPGVEIVFVPQGPDAVDDWILENCKAGEIVVTQDIPLAARAVALGAVVIEFRGQELDGLNIGDRSQMRDLITALRERGESSRGPRPFSAQARREFCRTLGKVLDRMLGAKKVV